MQDFVSYFDSKYRRITNINLLTIVACALFSVSACSVSAFDLKDTDGKTHKLADLKGKWIVVNFWATWCAPCVKEIPDIAEFAKEQAALGDHTRVIGIAVDWDETGKRDVDAAKLKRVAKKIGHSYPLVLADDATEKTFGRIKGMPTTLVYNADGKLVYNKTGVVTKELLVRILKGEVIK